jgi:hypothetical protein
MIALITFIVVFVAACVSKGAVFFMIAQIRIPSNVTRRQFHTVTNPPLEYCPGNIRNRSENNDTNYYVDFGETQSISWMW